MLPRENPQLFGHEAAEASFIAAFREGRMPHAWIIAGEKGIGKATLCYRFARALLSNTLVESRTVAETDPVFRRLAAGSHADVLVVEPLFDEKKEEAKREINVEQARAIAAFLALTAAEGGWRVVIIDSADELNANGANAILKIVEEPPPRALLLLVSHAPGGLLPTLRSRCRLLKLQPLSETDFERVMQAQGAGNADIALLGALSGHSPGLALELHAHDGIELHQQLTTLFAQLPATAPEAVLQLSTLALAQKQHARWHILTQLILRLFSCAATRQGGLPMEQNALRAMLDCRPPHHWAEKYEAAAQQFSLAARQHLDYKTLLIAFFHGLLAP